jgi:predicted ArsR family transcriptional regulator
MIGGADFHSSPLQNLQAMDSPPPVGPSDPLAQPTRARLFALLAELKRPAETIELASHLGLHPNGVRIHVERLATAGLVTRSRTLQARGRPRDVWSVSPDARPAGVPPTGFRELGRWLARSIPARPARLREVEAAGRDIGQELAVSSANVKGTDPLGSALAALGFQPQVERDKPNRTTYCLRNCPYRDAVHENQAVVCTLHRGITRGLLDQLAPDAKLVDFVPKDPDTAGCLIEVSAE